jgi:hypothetical protein
MKDKQNDKNFSDERGKTDKEITEALDKIIFRAKLENNILQKILKKIQNQNPEDN